MYNIFTFLKRKAINLMQNFNVRINKKGIYLTNCQIELTTNLRFIILLNEV